MADRVVLFERVGSPGQGFLQGIAAGDVLLAGGFRFATSQVTIDSGGNITAAGANVGISASATLTASAATMVATTAADMTLSSGDDLILTAVDSILLTGSPITALSYLTTTATVTQAAVRIGSVAGDPSLLNDGDLWYNSTLGKFRKRENGVTSSFNASEAATFVVHPTAGVGDYTTIQDALNNLPAEGGLILVREGTYNISATITLPNKPVTIMGCGVQSTVIDLGSNAIYAFTAAFTGTAFQTQKFENLTITGDGTLNQKGFFFDDPSFFTQFSLKHVFVTNVDVMVDDDNSSGVDFDYVASTLADRAGVLHYEGVASNGTLWISNCTWENVNGAIKRGGISGAPFVNITNCRLDSGTTMDLGRAQVTGSRFAADGASNKKVSMGDVRGAEMSSCEFRGGAYLEFTTGPCTAVGNIFRDSPTRAIDVLVAITSGTISGNLFTWATEAVRNAGSGVVASGNQNAKVTETGSANNNRYTDITSTSTILGAGSTVEGVRRYDQTGGSTTGSFVSLFTHTNLKAVLGIGTIENTGTTSGNDMEVRETVTDAFGVTDSITTTVAAGDSYLLDPQTNFDTARPPYLSYQVEVRHPVAVTSFDVHHATEGAH